MIGGGVAGLSIAEKFSSVMNDVFLVEKDPFIGNGISSRNSEVIHAGIYYKPGSLKDHLLSEGKTKLYDYLSQRDIQFQRVGKFIISSSPEETDELIWITENATQCGLTDLFFDSENFKKRYPFIKSHEVLFSPSTGIFDSHYYMRSLQADFENNGGFVLKNNVFRLAELRAGRIRVTVDDLNCQDSYVVETPLIINCAGLDAVSIYNALPGDGPRFENRYVKGDYYSYSGKERLEHLIYPLPEKDGLGVHVTMDMSGQVRFGQSAYEINTINYEINTLNEQLFMQSISKCWPSIDKSLISPSYSGIRPKLVGIDDFVVKEKVVNDNLMVSILGYESPGLTASLGVAEYVHDICFKTYGFEN